MAHAESAPTVGDRAPDFELPDALSGERYTLARLLSAERALLLVFHRGMW
ncbi:MAG TPA: hypothetical protein VEI06_13955 [Gemmatimonadaceae bacterium]|nr:hypothetical protein [Gemmatimonadaceae bacterium]